jgi:hypothetical protein
VLGEKLLDPTPIFTVAAVQPIDRTTDDRLMQSYHGPRKYASAPTLLHALQDELTNEILRPRNPLTGHTQHVREENGRDFVAENRFRLGDVITGLSNQLCNALMIVGL